MHEYVPVRRHLYKLNELCHLIASYDLPATMCVLIELIPRFVVD